MTSLVQRVGEQAANAIEAFRSAAREFTAEYQWLRDNPPPYVVAPEIMREYESVLNRSRIIGGTLQSVTRAIDAVVGSVWRTTGADLAGVGLGALPIVPIAIVAGGTATLITGINAIRRFRETMKIFNELRAQNVPSDDAWRRAKEATAEPTLIGSLGRDAIFAAAGVAVLIYMLRQKR